jgi:hypothetical protein
VKVAVVAAAETVTEAGVVRTALLSAIVTVVPPVGPAFDSVTVQVLLPPELSAWGAHCNDEITGATVCTLITPPAPVIMSAFPSAPAAKDRSTDTVTDDPSVASGKAKTAVATTPPPIGLVFIPVARHVVDPAVELHVRILPAPVRAGPADTPIDVRAPDG